MSASGSGNLGPTFRQAPLSGGRTIRSECQSGEILAFTAGGQKVGAFSKSKVMEWCGWTETPYHRSCGG